ncbi:MAG: AzlD domain-containing protein [Pseudomonadota bacterium]
MSPSPDLLIAFLAMGLVTYVCRAAGFFAMGWVRLTPRVEAWLQAIPLAVVVAILAPAAASGRPPELLGILAAFIARQLSGNDFAGVGAGVAAVAVARYLLA